MIISVMYDGRIFNPGGIKWPAAVNVSDDGDGVTRVGGACPTTTAPPTTTAGPTTTPTPTSP